MLSEWLVDQLRVLSLFRGWGGEREKEREREIYIEFV